MRSVPLSGCSAPVIILSSVVLPAPLAPMTPDDAARRQLEGQVLEEHPVAVGLADSLRLDHHIAQPRAGRDVDLQLLAAPLVLLAQQLVVGADARLALGLAGAWRQADPLQLALPASAGAAFRLFSSRASRACFCSSQDE